MSACEYITVLFLICCFLILNAQLAVANKQCGQKLCSDLEYCSPYDNLCAPCSNICEDTHNKDENKCNSDCQSYKIYAANRNLREEVKDLRKLVTVFINLTCILLLIMILMGVLKIVQWRKRNKLNLTWIRKKLKLEKKQKQDQTATSVSVTATSGKPDLRLNMPTIGMQTPSVNSNGNTPSTATTTLSRRPTEDNTLDYAYDNPVMVSTPSPVAKPHESNL